jgi:hypothetical protein
VTATTDTAPHVVECRCSRTGAVALLVDNAIDQSPPTTESADDARLLAVPALIGSIVSAVCATVVLWLHLLGDPPDAELPTRVVVHMVLVASIMCVFSLHPLPPFHGLAAWIPLPRVESFHTAVRIGTPQRCGQLTLLLLSLQSRSSTAIRPRHHF